MLYKFFQIHIYSKLLKCFKAALVTENFSLALDICENKVQTKDDRKS